MDVSQFIAAFKNLAAQKKLDHGVISDILREAITKAFIKEDPDARMDVNIDIDAGKLEIYRLVRVVEQETEDFDDFNEILLKDAVEKFPDAKVGEDCRQLLDVSKIDRKMINYIRHFFMQKLTEITNKSIVKD